jgi:S1-C subfamily serine protease
VVEVVPASAAARAGIRPEDILLEVDGTPIDAVGDLQRLMVGERIGGSVRIRLSRRGEELEIAVVPDELTG